jgi:hypothetical protein
MQKIIFKYLLFLIAAAGLLTLSVAPATGADTVAKMKKEYLKLQLDNEDVIILDVRRGRDWSSSEFKIKNAQRAAPADFDNWANKYPKNKDLVLYCA